MITEPIEIQMDSKLHSDPGDGAAPGLRAGLAKEVKSLHKLEKGTAKNSNESPSLGTRENLEGNLPTAGNRNSSAGIGKGPPLIPQRVSGSKRGIQ